MILDGKVSVNMSACNDADGDLPTRHFFFLPQMKESNLHVYAAVNTILSYSLWHVLMAVSLFALSAHARSRLSDEQARPMLPPGDVKAIDFQLKIPTRDTKTNSDTQDLCNCLCAYDSLDVIYALTVIVFICLWLVNVANLTAFTMAIEWAVGCIAIGMHMCALWKSSRQLDLSFTRHNTTIDADYGKTLLSLVCVLVALCVLLGTVPPLTDIAHVHSWCAFLDCGSVKLRDGVWLDSDNMII
jgi:hypothetical protein